MPINPKRSRNVNYAFGINFGTNDDVISFDEMEREITVQTLEFLRDMPYSQFMKSLYWRLVRKEVLSRKGKRCSECNRTNDLQVHHTTYEHHGMEHRYLNDLVVLCSLCHAKQHTDKPLANELVKLCESKAFEVKNPIENNHYDPHAIKNYESEYGRSPG